MFLTALSFNSEAKAQNGYLQKKVQCMSCKLDLKGRKK